MPNILKKIRTCQYDSSIADGDEIKQVDDGSSGTRNKVSVLPSYEDGRMVYTAVSLTDPVGDTGMNEGIGTVRVTPQTSGGNKVSVYGALETLNTATQRCGVLIKGVVLFRNTGLYGLSADDGPHELPVVGIGRAILGPNPATAGFGSNDGSVQYNRTTFQPVGSHVILGRIGNYILVELGSDCLKR